MKWLDRIMRNCKRPSGSRVSAGVTLVSTGPGAINIAINRLDGSREVFRLEEGEKLTVTSRKWLSFEIEETT